VPAGGLECNGWQAVTKAHKESVAVQANDEVREAPFQVRGGTFTMMVLKLYDPMTNGFFALLADQITRSPGFFRNAPVVLDLEALPAETIGFSFPNFVARLRKQHLIAVGVQGGTARHQEAALAVGLPAMPVRRLAPTRVSPETADAGDHASASASASAPAPASVQALGGDSAPEALPVASGSAVAAGRGDGARGQPVPAGDASSTSVSSFGAASGTAVASPGRMAWNPPLVVTEPVRSGRQVYAENRDLVIAAAVSPGAEVLADGSIHIYGPLRGRAVAGLKGDQSARIFCLSMEAEMVSIAGLYRVNEDLDPETVRRPVQVYLENGYLCFSPI